MLIGLLTGLRLAERVDRVRRMDLRETPLLGQALEPKVKGVVTFGRSQVAGWPAGLLNSMQQGGGGARVAPSGTKLGCCHQRASFQTHNPGSVRRLGSGPRRS